MTAITLAITTLELLATLAVAPFLASVIVKTKAWFAGRAGPPWLQPYYDLYKLVRKEPVYSSTTTWIFRAGPVVNLAALLTAATLMPVLSSRSLLGFSGDLILFAYLLALGRMFTVLAAMDTGSSFEGMGASREVTFGAMVEPALFLAFVVLSVATHSLRLDEMLGPQLLGAWQTTGPAMVLLLGALFIVLLTETCRVPVDDPATHLELTMIHEVMVLDHSGPELAYITYGASLKFALLGSLLLHAAIPHPAALHIVDPVLRLAELVALAGAAGTVESVMARLRLNRVPLLLAGSSVLSALAVVLVLGRGLS
ncbi:MAG: NADH-quinone oxidoreductase subunit H [Candidatus Hydrogenedentes bacterium]|nr:NADH-quinone oxidoreductase subunit H [Candidatus Hydrogenedentota bacterium]